MKEVKQNKGHDFFLKKWIVDGLSPFGLAVYSAIRKCMVSDSGSIQVITLNSLYYHIYGHMKTDRGNEKYIKSGFEELVDLGYVSVIEKKGATYIIDCSRLWVDNNEHFISINRDVFEKIIRTTNNYRLYMYYVYLLSTISYSINVILDDGQAKKGVVGNCSLDYLSDITGLSRNTIMNYNKILEENEIIYVYRHDDFVMKPDGHIMQLANVYGRYEDRAYVITYGESQKRYKNAYKTQTKYLGVNAKRRLAQKYNQLVSGNGSKYTLEDIVVIYNYVIDENNKYRRLAEKKCDVLYLDKVRDTKIFEKYGLFEDIDNEGGEINA